MSDYSVRITIKNGRILRLMRDAGIATMAELSRRCGVTQTRLGEIVNFKKSPRAQCGNWRDGIEDIAGVLGCDPEDMFTEAQLTMSLPSNSREVQMDEADVVGLISRTSPEAITWIKMEANRLMGCLSPREKFVIEQRYNGADLHETAEELANMENASKPVTSCRIMQMGQRALEKMRKFSLNHGGDRKFSHA